MKKGLSEPQPPKHKTLGVKIEGPQKKTRMAYDGFLPISLPEKSCLQKRIHIISQYANQPVTKQCGFQVQILAANEIMQAQYQKLLQQGLLDYLREHYSKNGGLHSVRWKGR